MLEGGSAYAAYTSRGPITKKINKKYMCQHKLIQKKNNHYNVVLTQIGVLNRALMLINKKRTICWGEAARTQPVPTEVDSTNSPLTRGPSWAPGRAHATLQQEVGEQRNSAQSTKLYVGRRMRERSRHRQTFNKQNKVKLSVW